MSQIKVTNLTFSYHTYFEHIFENTSFVIDSDWKLGLISRNGRGKTTFLNLLMGKYTYSGQIQAQLTFDYFPFDVSDVSMNTKVIMKDIIGPFEILEQSMDERLEDGSEEAMYHYAELLDRYSAIDGFIIEELIEKELNKLQVVIDVLERPFNTLSNGEQTKVLLAALFMKQNNFLLIDEPTNHLDLEARQLIGDYLNTKKGYILVSHDRHLLDTCVDHILSINKANIEVQKGNYSTWRLNKDYEDQFEIGQNERLRKEVKGLQTAVRRTAKWSDRVEHSKIGGGACDRGFIGHKAAKMMKRSKAIEVRRNSALEEKKSLLKNIEVAEHLSMHQLVTPHKLMIEAEALVMAYEGKLINSPISFEIHKGDRVCLRGGNGSGKTSLIKLILGENLSHKGYLKKANDLVISYIAQDTSHLKGQLRDVAVDLGLDESLFKAILRKLDFSREQFEKPLQSYSAGQKKKVLLAASLSTPAHLFIWDEPLNYIDVLSRDQIEDVVLTYGPTLLFVEHDRMFSEKIMTKLLVIGKS